MAALRGDLAGFLEAVRFPSLPRPGLYAYQTHPPGGSRRIHLRVHADRSAALLVDVTDAVHLNPTAAVLAWLALEGAPPEEAARLLWRRFGNVDSTALERAVAEVYALVDHLAGTTDACPTCGLLEDHFQTSEVFKTSEVCAADVSGGRESLSAGGRPARQARPAEKDSRPPSRPVGLQRTPLFSTPVHAPYKADLALSYGCNNACGHCYNQPRRRTMPSLSLADWRRVLRKLARVGIPQVIFTGGEPTLFDGLAELIQYADRLGLVAGINTNGRRLADIEYAHALARAGASHVQITLESCRPRVHNLMTGADSFDQTLGGIRNALAAGLHTITNTTLTRRNAGHAEEIVDFLDGLGLRTFAANGMIHSGAGRDHADALPEDELAPVLVRLRDRAAELGMRFLWYTPTDYCRLSPVELELGPRRCNAGEYSICIEPGGDVLPCQSYYRPVGNLLRDPWPAIWNSPLFRSFRDRVADPLGCGLPAECRDCPDLASCGGGCRLTREDAGNGETPRLAASHQASD